MNIAGSNGPRISCISTMSSVNEACANGVWNRSRGRHPIIVLLRSCLPPDLPPSLTTESDLFFWRNSVGSQPELFSNSKTCLSLHHSPPSVSWHKVVWPKVQISKYSFLFWVVLRDRLPTRDRLRSWGFNVPPECLLCESQSESRSHILFNRDFKDYLQSQ